jgi:hypothetical protein
MNFQAVTLNGQKVTKATWAVPKTKRILPYRQYQRLERDVFHYY